MHGKKGPERARKTTNCLGKGREAVKSKFQGGSECHRFGETVLSMRGWRKSGSKATRPLKGFRLVPDVQTH